MSHYGKAIYMILRVPWLCLIATGYCVADS